MEERDQELAKREQETHAFEAGIDALAAGEIEFFRDGKGRELLHLKATRDRNEELRRQIRPAFERVREIARRNSEAVAEKVALEVADQREMLTSMIQAYRNAIETMRANSDAFLRALARLGKEARKRVLEDKRLNETKEAAEKLKATKPTQPPTELSPAELDQFRRMRDGSGLG